jgi:hypothetical protein
MLSQKYLIQYNVPGLLRHSGEPILYQIGPVEADEVDEIVSDLVELSGAENVTTVPCCDCEGDT